MITITGGGNYLELRDRMWKGFTTIEKANPEGIILIVGYEGNFMYILADLCENVSPDYISDKHLVNCAITTLDLTMKDSELSSKLIKFADASHVTGDAGNFILGVPEKVKKIKDYCIVPHA